MQPLAIRTANRGLMALGLQSTGLRWRRTRNLPIPDLKSSPIASWTERPNLVGLNMKVSELADLAGAIAATSGQLFRGRGRIFDCHVQQYWNFSRERMGYWRDSLQGHLQRTEAIDMQSPEGHSYWKHVQPTIEEILVSEISTRVWSSVATCYDRKLGVGDIEPVVRGVFIGHQECRNRALTMLLSGIHCPRRDAANLNQLRIRCERWCDLLLGYLESCAPSVSVGFCFDPARVAQFAEERREQLHGPMGSLGWSVLLASLQASFRKTAKSKCPNPQLNTLVGQSILECVDAVEFSSLGAELGDFTNRVDRASEEVLTLLAKIQDC